MNQSLTFTLLLTLLFMSTYGQKKQLTIQNFKFVKKKADIPLPSERNITFECQKGISDQLMVSVRFYSAMKEGQFDNTVVLTTDSSAYSIVDVSLEEKIEIVKKVVMSTEDENGSAASAKTSQMNSRSTHATTFNHGSTSTQVNPNGTHTTTFNHGNTSTQVNPDGTHTTIFNQGSTSTQVNPNGTHTTTFNHGSTSTQVNPDGTHTTTFNHGNTATQVNPNGTHTTNHNTVHNRPTRIYDTYEDNYEIIEEDIKLNTIAFKLEASVFDNILMSKQLAFKISSSSQEIFFGLRKYHLKKIKQLLIE